MEEVDILIPPDFQPSGETSTATEAIIAGKWLGTGNVWVYKLINEELFFLYQFRDDQSPWMPGKLDVSSGGYYQAGETVSLNARKKGMLRELKEELGLDIASDRLVFITRRLNVGISQKGNERKTCADIFALEIDNNEKIIPDGKEVPAYCWIGIDQLSNIYNENKIEEVYKVSSIDQKEPVEVCIQNFVTNYDDYLFMMPKYIATLL